MYIFFPLTGKKCCITIILAFSLSNTISGSNRYVWCKKFYIYECFKFNVMSFMLFAEFGKV